MNKDYMVEVKVKNNKLFAFIKKAGFETVAEFSRHSKIEATTLSAALNLKIPLYGERGKVLSVWDKLSDYFKVLPEDLVPKEFYFEKLQKNKAMAEMEFSEIESLTNITRSAESEFLLTQVSETLNSVLSKLTPREEKVIRMMHGLEGNGEHTFTEVGAALNVTREGVRHIYKKALRKLRNPENAPKLKPFLESYSEVL